MTAVRRARLLITGLVQGVCYRSSTFQMALHLRLKGWVRNLEDGRVEILAEGPEPAIKKLEAWCERGPAEARVDEVDLTWLDPSDNEGSLAQFRIAR